MTLPKSSDQLGWEDKPKEDAKVESAKGGSTNLDANAEANVTGTKKDVKVDANVKDSKSAVSSNAFASGSAQGSPRIHKATTPFDLTFPSFDCLCKPYALTQVTIISLLIHKL